MAQTVTRHQKGEPTDHRPSSPWAMGASVFAGCTMVVLGILQFFEGIVALVDGNDFLLRTPNYVFRFDASVWGWTHMGIGLLVALAGAFVFSGSRVARGVGILIASLSAIANFLWIPYYPFWGLALVALNVFVIWGLASSNLRDD
jgi:hypothetical protein